MDYKLNNNNRINNTWIFTSHPLQFFLFWFSIRLVVCLALRFYCQKSLMPFLPPKQTDPNININITLCFLNQLVRQSPWYMCLQYPIRIWSEYFICSKQMMHYWSVSPYFKFPLTIGCIVLSAGFDTSLKMHTGK